MRSDQPLRVAQFVQLARDVQALAHGAAIVELQDRHLLGADQFDAGRLVVVEQVDLLDRHLLVVGDHLGAHAERAVVVQIELHAASSVRTGCRV
ncbi:hypothetical protein D3C78_1459910 [compost metagenome]